MSEQQDHPDFVKVSVQILKHINFLNNGSRVNDELANPYHQIGEISKRYDSDISISFELKAVEREHHEKSDSSLNVEGTLRIHDPKKVVCIEVLVKLPTWVEAAKFETLPTKHIHTEPHVASSAVNFDRSAGDFIADYTLDEITNELRLICHDLDQLQIRNYLPQELRRKLIAIDIGD